MIILLRLTGINPRRVEYELRVMRYVVSCLSPLIIKNKTKRAFRKSLFFNAYRLTY